MSEHRTLGEILQDLGRISQDDVDRALAYQRDNGGFFGEALIALGVVQEEELGWSLASQFDLPYMFPEADAVDPEAAALVTPEWALRHMALPVALSRERVVLMADSPLNREAAEELEVRTGLSVDLALASTASIRDVIRKVFARGRRRREGLTTSEPVDLGELRRLAAKSGADAWGISVRGQRALGWYGNGDVLRRYRLRAGWEKALDDAVAPSPSERIEDSGKAEWTAELVGGAGAGPVRVCAIATPEGREILVTRREAEGSDAGPPNLPDDLLAEIRLLLEKADVVVAIRSEPEATAGEVVPHLPSLLFPAGHRSLHLGGGGDVPTVGEVLALPLQGPRALGGRRLADLAGFRFDAITAELEPRTIDLWPSIRELAPVVFLAVREIGHVELAGLEGVDWLLELETDDAVDAPLRWSLRHPGES